LGFVVAFCLATKESLDSLAALSTSTPPPLNAFCYSERFGVELAK
jgi:hypothetical protein